MSADKSPIPSPIQRALNLAVFGPLGMALAAKDALPEWVDKGRARLVEHFTTCKSVGQLVTDYGQQKVAATLVGLGILPGPPPPTSDNPPVTTAAVGAGAGAAPSPNGRRAAPAGGETGPAPNAGALAIPGYDSLSASQVVSRLAGLAPGELEAVRVYEAASRGRRTVLTRVSQIQAGRF